MVVEKSGVRTLVLLPELALESEIYGRPDLSLDDVVKVQLSDVNLPTLEVRWRVMK
jgi:hypothetical protein